MILEKVHIKKFRGFINQEFKLGSQITIIVGQNATQKSTLLGLISQPFSTKSEEHPMHHEKPLCGGSFHSLFSEKFKLSLEHDEVGSHEWTLDTKDNEPFTLTSIWREKNKSLRFWKKGDKSKDSGYLPYPVIILSLIRLIPLAESSAHEDKKEETLTLEEQNEFINLHHEILIGAKEQETSISRIKGNRLDKKNTFGINTKQYDWQTNSAGQDNVGKILAALLSFKRLQEKYPKDYKGGILAIDELEATMYPASQINLLKVLRRYSSRYNIQIIFTTHSTELINHIAETKEDKAKQKKKK